MENSDMESIKISVIVPVYNIREYLKKCIDSILGQIYKNLEIILVDDGSTDGSGELCDAYKEADARILVLHKQNGGVSAARNAGVQMATGEYITFVDSDDYLEPDMYEKMIAAATEKKLNVIACGYFHNDIPQELKSSEPLEILDSESAIKLCIKDDASAAMCGAVWNKLYKASVLREYLVFNAKYIMAEDMLVTVRCLKHAKAIGQLNWCGYHYVQRENSVVNSFKKGKSSSVCAHGEMFEELKKEYPGLAEAVKVRSVEQSYYLLRETMRAKELFADDMAVLQKDLKENKQFLKQSQRITGIERKLLYLTIKIKCMPKLLWWGYGKTRKK